MPNARVLIWLLGAPQFWYGFVACATLVFLALLPSIPFPRKGVIVYDIPERAPVPTSDPFYKPGSRRYTTNRMGTARREHRHGLAEERLHSGTKHNPQRGRTDSARKKRAIWHPHPDDQPTWGCR